MAIIIRSETTGGTTTSATDGTFSVTKPSTVLNGDYLICIIGKQDDPDIAPPGDWTTGGEGGSSTGNDIFLGIYYKKITNAAGEGSSYTFDSAGTSESVGWWIGSVANIDGTTPQDVAFVNPSNLQNDTSPNTPAVTTATDKAFALACWAINSDSTTTPPGSPWSTRADNVGGNGVLTVVSQTIATSGTSTGTPEVTDVANNQESQVGMFCFRYGGDNIFVNDAYCDDQTDNVVLTGIPSTLTVADAYCVSQADAPAVTKETSIVVADASCETQTDNVATTKNTSIVVADAYCETQTDNIATTKSDTLVIADAYCETQADNVVLEYTPANARARVTWIEFQVPEGTAPTLSPSDSSSTTQADEVTLTQEHNLIVADSACLTQADEIILTGSTTLTVQDAYCETQSDNILLTQVHALNVEDAYCETFADIIPLGGEIVLTVDDSYVTTQTDALLLTYESALVVADAFCTTQTDSILLTQEHALVIGDAYCETQSDIISLTQAHVLVVGDSYSISQADNVIITEVSAVAGPGNLRQIHAQSKRNIEPEAYVQVGAMKSKNIEPDALPTIKPTKSKSIKR